MCRCVVVLVDPIVCTCEFCATTMITFDNQSSEELLSELDTSLLEAFAVLADYSLIFYS